MTKARRQAPASAKIAIMNADQMLMQQFRLHCGLRHPLMRFRSRGEHEADHRLHGETLDHVHSREAEAEDTTESDSEPGN